MKFKIVLMLVLVSLIVMGGCGGGGGGKPDTPVITDPVTPDPTLQGVWIFSSDNSKKMLLGDGLDFWLLQMDIQYNPQTLVVFNSAGLSLPWHVEAHQFNLSAPQTSPTSLDVGLGGGNNNSINVTLNEDVSSFSAVDNLFADFSSAVGTWTADYNELSAMNLTIDADGNLSGQWRISTDTCDVTGALTPKNGVDFFAVSYTEGSGCVRGEQTLSGVGFVADFTSSQRLYLLLSDQTNSTGAVFMGTRAPVIYVPGPK